MAGSSIAPRICQLASGHSVEDERILHRMARTAAQHGYRSSFVVPHAAATPCEGVELVACPRIPAKPGRWRRWTASLPLLFWALRSDGALFQIHDPDLLPAGLVLKMFRRRVVYDVHDDFEATAKVRFRSRPRLARWISRLWGFFERHAAHAMDGVIVADRHLAQKFARCRPVLLGNYPRLDFTPPARAEAETTFNLVYVGAISRERGLEMALAALRKLPMSDVRLHVVGAGQDAELLAALRAEPRVVLHGRVPWTELHRIYVRAHVGLALYQPLETYLYYPGENAVKILEYMAAGIPVLCSDFSGLKKFVEDAGCGWVAPPDDPEAIARQIERLYRDAETRKRLGARGRRLFETEFNWEMHENKLVDLYRRILGA